MSGVDSPIDYYGLIQSDLSRYGGKPTRSIRELLSSDAMPDNSTMIVAGGEVLAASWCDMMIDLVRNPLKFLLRFARRAGGRRAISRVSSRILGVDLVYPWVLTPGDFSSNVRIVYNAVGGVDLRLLPTPEQALVRRMVTTASYISVRDRETKLLLDNWEDVSAVELCPDSAVLISDLFSPEELEANISPDVRRVNNRFPDGYICFQSCVPSIRHRHELIAEQLGAASKARGLGVILLPLLRTGRPNDELAMRRIQGCLDVPSFIPGEASIYDIMWLISKSRVFLGSSLHGCITALSFARPFLGLTEGIFKLHTFLATWGLDQHDCPSCDTVGERLDLVLRLSDKVLRAKRDEIASMARCRINNLITIATH